MSRKSGLKQDPGSVVAKYSSLLDPTVIADNAGADLVSVYIELHNLHPEVQGSPRTLAAFEERTALIFREAKLATLKRALTGLREERISTPDLFDEDRFPHLSREEGCSLIEVCIKMLTPPAVQS